MGKSVEHDTAQVNHPSHYTQYNIEVIEITRLLDFCLGNVVKYVLRAPFKDGINDLKKAMWYLRLVPENFYYELPRSEMQKFRDAYCKIMASDINHFQGRFMASLMDYMETGLPVAVNNMYLAISDWVKVYDSRSED